MNVTQLSLMAVVAASLLIGNPLQAQDAEKKGPGPRGEQMVKELGLTPEQATKVRAAMDEQRKKGQEIRENTSLSDEQKREKGQALRQDMQKKMKEILTAEQYAKWESMRPAKGPGGPGKGKGQAKKEN
jgi:Spy/CpxP family protein refolding chaperone